MAKAVVMFSGGLDSLLVIEILKRQEIEVIPVYLRLPLGSRYNKTPEMKGLRIIDCTSGRLLQEYMRIIRKPKHGYGSGINPCIDCHIFMLKKAKGIMKKFKADFIATGEVLGERPMSQHKKALELIERESGLKGKLLRPLSAKLLDETEAEKKGLIDRNKLLDIQGRSRKKQIELAEKYKIRYPSPGGGCLLCEREFAERLKNLLKIRNKISYGEIELLKVGRHFLFEKSIIVVGRNQKENRIIMNLGKIKMEVKDIPSPVTTIIGKVNNEILKKAAELTIKYSDAEKLKRDKVEVIRLK